MPKQRKSETEPSLSQMAEPDSAALGKQPRSARLKKAAAKPRATKEPAVVHAAAPPGPRITHEEIARLAYSYWEARQSPHGSAEDDWFRAERELRAMLKPSC